MPWGLAGRAVPLAMGYTARGEMPGDQYRVMDETGGVGFVSQETGGVV